MSLSDKISRRNHGEKSKHSHGANERASIDLGKRQKIALRNLVKGCEEYRELSGLNDASDYERHSPRKGND